MSSKIPSLEKHLLTASISRLSPSLQIFFHENFESRHGVDQLVFTRTTQPIFHYYLLRQTNVSETNGHYVAFYSSFRVPFFFDSLNATPDYFLKYFNLNVDFSSVKTLGCSLQTQSMTTCGYWVWFFAYYLSQKKSTGEVISPSDFLDFAHRTLVQTHPTSIEKLNQSLYFFYLRNN
jgi:hypothetical protein